MWFLCLIFVVQIGITILAHESERHYHNGTLLSFNIYSIICRVSYCFVGWSGLGKGNWEVVVVAMLAGIVGDTFGAIRFRTGFKEEEHDDDDENPLYHLYD